MGPWIRVSTHCISLLIFLFLFFLLKLAAVVAVIAADISGAVPVCHHGRTALFLRVGRTMVDAVECAAQFQQYASVSSRIFGFSL